MAIVVREIAPVDIVVFEVLAHGNGIGNVLELVSNRLVKLGLRLRIAYRSRILGAIPLASVLGDLLSLLFALDRLLQNLNHEFLHVGHLRIDGALGQCGVYQVLRVGERMARPVVAADAIKAVQFTVVHLRQTFGEIANVAVAAL